MTQRQTVEKKTRLVRNEQRFRIERHASLLLRTRPKADPLRSKSSGAARVRPERLLRSTRRALANLDPASRVERKSAAKGSFRVVPTAHARRAPVLPCAASRFDSTGLGRSERIGGDVRVKERAVRELGSSGRGGARLFGSLPVRCA